jgi:putative chitinase
MFDRKTYFDSVRASLFGGSLQQGQVDGQNAILGEWEKHEELVDIRWLAYMLATTIHETANKMWPITEYGSESYLKGKPYYPYIGRGFVQLTWEDNYRKATDKLGLEGDDDLVEHPDRALDLTIATNIMFSGMQQGWFTGKRLDHYFNSSKNDPKNARQIINGNDDDTLIAGYHDKFLTALKAAAAAVTPEPEPPIIPLVSGDHVWLGVPSGTKVIVNGVEIIAR